MTDSMPLRRLGDSGFIDYKRTHVDVMVVPWSVFPMIYFPSHLNVEVIAQVLGKAYELAVTGTGESTPCIGFTIVICDARVLLRKDAEGDGMYGEVSNDDYDFTAVMAQRKPIWTDEGFKQLQLAALRDGMILIDAVQYPGVIAAANFMATSIALGDRIGGGARHRAASAISQAAGGCYVIKGSEDATRLPPPPNAAFHVFCNQPKSEKAPITDELNKVAEAVMAMAATKEATAPVPAVETAGAVAQQLGCAAPEDKAYGYQWWVPQHEGGQARIFSAFGFGDVIEEESNRHTKNFRHLPQAARSHPPLWL